MLELVPVVILSAPFIALGVFIGVKANVPKDAFVLLPVGLVLVPVAVFMFTVGVLIWPTAMILIGLGGVALARGRARQAPDPK
jgi:hypothetical protein